MVTNTNKYKLLLPATDFLHTVRFGMALCILDVLDYFNLV
ncbi:hypothetical protein STM474_0312 [Salmonella enterica subsp. enterica serovar Typhimurium str. ST4/74]|uniref:Uncharacterized protein n=1 Tax=Salmonella typhimurium (strain 4/74) TaxID=909946 RepID=E8XIW5_SALT4|nr:hypothetical protein STM474_0312 [Salmonella enterica subsp. enterica serovar Typhimurium str. ST4/74]